MLRKRARAIWNSFSQCPQARSPGVSTPPTTASVTTSPQVSIYRDSMHFCESEAIVPWLGLLFNALSLPKAESSAANQQVMQAMEASMEASRRCRCA